ncbi:MAG: response regulator [Acidobacteria bacterium]|nr:response regulator [Acidobacteriota bacterium]
MVRERAALLGSQPHAAQNCVAVVDDDPSVRKGVSRLLRLCGFDVAEYHSGESFLSTADASRLACVLLDIHLGGLTGIEVKAELARTGSTLPVIFMTADEETAARVAPCLTKPFTKLQLLSLIDEVFRTQ